jgi:hypothetical protein
MEFDLEVNAEKTKYMLLSRHQNAGKNHNTKTGDRSFENVAQFKYLGTTVTNQNLIQKEIKRTLNSGNACYHSVQKLLTSHLLSKNVTITIYKSIILPVVLNGRETWPLTVRKEHRLRLFENRVLRRIFGLERDEVIGGWRKLYNEELHNLCPSSSIIRIIKSKKMGLAGHVARMGEKRKRYRILVGRPEGKSPPGTPRRRWEDNIRMDLREIGCGGMDWMDLAQDRD